MSLARGVDLIPVSSCTYFEFILLQIIFDLDWFLISYYFYHSQLGMNLYAGSCDRLAELKRLIKRNRYHLNTSDALA